MAKQISKKRLEELKKSGALVSGQKRAEPAAQAQDVAKPEPDLDGFQRVLKQMVEAQNSEMAQITETIREMGNKINTDVKVVYDKPLPVSKIKVRNIKRCDKGRMKDMDLIVERGERVLN